jgi:hypothetical protein
LTRALPAVVILAAGCQMQPTMPTMGSCDIVVIGSTADDAHTCTDFQSAVGVSLGGFKMACMSSSATTQKWSDSLCTHVGAVAGCQSSDSSVTQTVWHFAGTTAEWMAACMPPSQFFNP